MHFWSPKRKKDNSEYDKKVGCHIGFNLVNIRCDGLPYLLWTKPIRNLFLEKHCPNYLPPSREGTRD
jgi:hypothetical protein